MVYEFFFKITGILSLAVRSILSLGRETVFTFECDTGVLKKNCVAIGNIFFSFMA